MNGILLGTKGLACLIAGDSVLGRWLEKQGDTPLHATYASVASLLASAELDSNIARRREWVERLTNDLPGDFGPRLHGFDLAAAKRWSAVRAGLKPEDKVIETDIFVVAVALAEDLDYVAPRRDWHGAVDGLRLHDPWAGP